MDKKIQSKYILGDHWLYYKVYSGPKTSDMILTEIVKPLTQKLIKEKVIDKWFFIRFNDPKYHLRLRFYCIDKKNVGLIINELNEQLKPSIDQGLIWKVQSDTYMRELKRYGSNTMEMSEELFYHDSKMIVDFIDMIEGEEGEELRWLFALKATDALLESFQYSNARKQGLLNDLKIGFALEFGKTKFLGKQLNDKYREDRPKIANFIAFKENDIPDYEPIIGVLREKEHHISTIAARILKLNQDHKLELHIDDLMASYIHMLMNRVFKSKNRLNEMVCYDFLSRYYNSLIARSKVS
ncbi:thiopeptide-type bacteriocin biosynthesis protein [Psychroserpens luteolus]|uniref:thiopeptide-type bacteriocin biosynthesis protein n=1 Tax=Psychroserpens luteolus TaxID=2855840 RepID=UPI001E628AEF|nr:thiopeptide-type bacteriocin biosynthesis protein [Psychroserpens luteolus]MCD2258056.1 thiopeptide-type bacteriocin biosynthesis protein [Psychroserpens luteolus]